MTHSVHLFISHAEDEAVPWSKRDVLVEWTFREAADDCSVLEFYDGEQIFLLIEVAVEVDSVEDVESVDKFWSELVNTHESFELVRKEERFLALHL